MKITGKKIIAPLGAIILALTTQSAQAINSYETSLKMISSSMLSQSSQMVGINWKTSVADSVLVGGSGNTVISQLHYDDGTYAHKASYYDFTLDAEYRFKSFSVFTPAALFSGGLGRLGYRDVNTHEYISTGVKVFRGQLGLSTAVSESVHIDGAISYRYAKIAASNRMQNDQKVAGVEYILGLTTIL